jgi:hypothetical protein
VDEILEQVDNEVGEERDYNQVDTGTVHILYCAFLGSGYWSLYAVYAPRSGAKEKCPKTAFGRLQSVRWLGKEMLYKVCFLSGHKQPLASFVLL